MPTEIATREIGAHGGMWKALIANTGSIIVR
jgi:hypothetical protein